MGYSLMQGSKSTLNKSTLPKSTAVILDSSRGLRYLDNKRSQPESLSSVENTRTVLDWTLNSLGEFDVENVTYVGGYHIEKVVERYPKLSFRFHKNWETEGELMGLTLCDSTPELGCVILRAGTLCLPNAIRQLLEEQEITVGIYIDGSMDIPLGIVWIPPKFIESSMEVAKALIEMGQDSDLYDWVSALDKKGYPIRRVNLNGCAAPASNRNVIAKTVFGGKGRTLQQVAPLVRTAKVLDQIMFTVDEWNNDSGKVINRIQKSFPAGKVVVRSSASSEDGLEQSFAGVFQSVLDVQVESGTSLADAILAVLKSYQQDGRDFSEKDEVLVQPQIANLTACGVILTRDLETGAPYYILNVDRKTGRSDIVTSGAEEDFDTYYISRNANHSHLDSDVKKCILLARELEELTCLDTLDIEFGINQEGEIFLFQVRPIALKARKFELADEDLEEVLERTGTFVAGLIYHHPTLQGRKSILGTMPDWNPAEMIGTSPRPMALSLYQRLIGDETWAKARALIGYKDVRPEPLIISLAGQPYVDVRASLNSFLPSDIDSDLAETWVNYCLNQLSANPELHDKLEFEVAITCLTFDFNLQSERLKEAGLDEKSITCFRQSLLKLTDKVIKGETEPISQQIKLIQKLGMRRSRWTDADAKDQFSLVRRINSLLRDCEHFGILPFSILARYAFIGVNLLKSLESTGVMSLSDHEKLLGSIPSVASNISRDLSALAIGDLPIGEWIKKYGHLRPSSYDITSSNYKTAWKNYFYKAAEEIGDGNYPCISEAKTILDRHKPAISECLRSMNFTASADQLAKFILESIPGREWAKFEFMKSVNQILEDITKFGELSGFSCEEMSFLSIDQILRGSTESAGSSSEIYLRRNIHHNLKHWNLTSALRLPHLIRSVEEIGAFKLGNCIPNFISSSIVRAPLIVIKEDEVQETLEGKIVAIRAADPGYDWIFSHSIAGLITLYGGVASHMSIRAAEFGLPAAIGCGEAIFKRICKSSMIELDCASKKIRVIS